ncbi:hypothetical protein F383_29743 [Gossypium arboreum]|uniref:Uncharacterized protein n=1 Tax=Gossypium arboreum TaxID=29729 RepID=A0A0B0N0K4_GOSAR|nr:hypothetical protein F383_29743 [Gossypium arboreum]
MAWTSSHGQTTRPCPFGKVKQSDMGVSHGCVPAEPKISPIRKRPILRALRHSKAYLNT